MRRLGIEVESYALREALRESSGGDLLLVSEVAELLRCTPTTVYRMIARGDITPTRIGNRIRIYRREVFAFLEREGRPPVQP